MELIRHYKWDLLITLVVIAAAAVFVSPLAIIPLVILIIMEVSFSFDNAIVNAAVLERMSPLWQKLFLTIGMLVAVLGMRFVFPIGIVAITTQMGFGDVVVLAVNDPLTYAEKLDGAHELIAMFGGIYLLLIFLNFIFEEREIMWLQKIEKPLAAAGRLDNVSYIIAGIIVFVASVYVDAEHMLSLMLAGFASIVVFMVVDSVSKLFDADDDGGPKGIVRHGWGAFSLFMYLEVQDSAFSFDGVSAAFAITDNIFLIAGGLGVGALFVRSMTVHLVKTGKLGEFRYLEHGAHWAIGALAVCMLLALGSIEVSEYVTGLIGVVFIVAAGYHSHVMNKRDEAALAAEADSALDSYPASETRSIV